MKHVQQFRGEIFEDKMELSCEDTIAMEIHFEAKGSYTQELKLLSAVKQKLLKGTFGFPAVNDLVNYKRGLKLPRPGLKVFQNTSGKTIGRVCDFMELVRFLFENKDIVKHCNWFMSSPTIAIPRAIMVNHTNGARQSLTIELVSCIRILRLLKVSRNPAAQLILAIEQSHESTELFDLIFTRGNFGVENQL